MDLQSGGDRVSAIDLIGKAGARERLRRLTSDGCSGPAARTRTRTRTCQPVAFRLAGHL